MNMNILVTGASGFLGRPVCGALQQCGYHVTALNRRLQPGPWDQQFLFNLQYPTIDADILTGIDAVIHLAGIAHDSGFTQAEYAQLNVRASLSLALMSLGANVDRFIYISSGRVAGVIENEDSVDDYANSKYDAELGLRKISAEQQLPLTIVRPALVYGAGVKGNLARMLNAVQQGWFPPPPATEGGVAMIASKDVAGAIIAILTHANTTGKTYGLDDGEVYNPRRIYTEIKKQLHRPIPAWSMPMALLKSAAKIGDFSDRNGVHLPLTSSVLEKLFANTAHHCNALTEDTGWHPTRTLADELPGMLV